MVTTLWSNSLSKDIITPSPLPNSFPCTYVISPTIVLAMHIWAIGCTFPTTIITSKPSPLFPYIFYSFKPISVGSPISPPPQRFNVSNFLGMMNYISACFSTLFSLKCYCNLATLVWLSSLVFDNPSLFYALSFSGLVNNYNFHHQILATHCLEPLAPYH